MAAKEIEVSTQPNIKVNLENHEATHYTCTEEKKTTKRALVDRGNAASFSSELDCGFILREIKGFL